MSNLREDWVMQKNSMVCDKRDCGNDKFSMNSTLICPVMNLEKLARWLVNELVKVRQTTTTFKKSI